jgi:hypothetical protein
MDPEKRVKKKIFIKVGNIYKNEVNNMYIYIYIYITHIEREREREEYTRVTMTMFTIHSSRTC